MIGTTVSHYRILRKIGEGGMGEVYLAQDTKLKREVALKFLAEDLTRDETRRRRFVQEARATAAIGHPHIAVVHEIGESDGRTFIAMEHVRGKSLRTTIRGRDLDLRKALELAVQVAEGLSAAHQRGIVHRDLKPDNVLVSEQGYAKLIDFGLAKLVEPSMLGGKLGPEDITKTQIRTREGVVMGTVAYMSPEQGRGQTIDVRSDIFSFGVVLYEMMSGKSPFRRGTVVETLNAVINDSLPPLMLRTGDTPAELERITRKCSAKDPDERYQSMKDLVVDLKDLRKLIVGGGRPAVVERGPRPLMWAGAALTVATVVALGLLRSGPSAPPGIGASGRPAVAVMHFESTGTEEEIGWLSKGLPTMLTTGLSQTPGLDVVSGQRIQQILKQIGQEDLESFDETSVAEVARLAGVGAVVTGGIFKAGREIRLEVQIHDVSSGRILTAQSIRGEDIFPMVDEITARIRTSLSLGDRPEGRPLAEITTASFEAFRLYSDGLDASSNFRLGDARELLERAVAIDPSFAMAQLELSVLADTRGEFGVASSHLDKAYENRKRLPERQRLAIEAHYAFVRDRNRVKAVELYEELVSRYPDDEHGYDRLSGAYIATNRMEDAASAARRGLEISPNSGPLHNKRGYALLYLGRYPEAVDAFEAYARLEPEEPNAHDSLGEALLVNGQSERALRTYARALKLDPSFYVSHLGRSWAYAMMGRYGDFFGEMAEFQDVAEQSGGPPVVFHFLNALALSRLGRIQEAREHVIEGRELAEELEDLHSHAAVELVAALIALERGEHETVFSAIGRVEAILQRVTDPRWQNNLRMVSALLAGTARARSGDLDAAREQLDIQRQVYDEGNPAHVWWHRALEGEIDLASGDLAAAEKAFMAGEPKLKMVFGLAAPIRNSLRNVLPFHDGLARVEKAEGKSAEAIEIYRQLLEPGLEVRWTTWLEPRYVLELARLLDETGDTEGARTEYGRFLDLWKNADEGLPELEEARVYVGQ